MTEAGAAKGEKKLRFRRILMALDPASDDLSAVDAAAALARRLHAELLSLFVEDIDLVRLAQHPHVEAYSTLSASRQPLAAEYLQRMLRMQLARSRQAVEQAAVRQRIKVAFQVRQGRPVAEILSAAGDSDLVVVEWARRDTRASSTLSWIQSAAKVQAIAEAASRSVLLLRPGAPIGGTILVVYDGSDFARRALETAAEIADRDNGVLEVMLLTGRMDQVEEWRREFAAAFEDTHLVVRILHMPNAGPEDLCRQAERQGVSLIVIGAAQDARQGKAWQRIIARANCSVLLVR